MLKNKEQQGKLRVCREMNLSKWAKWQERTIEFIVVSRAVIMIMKPSLSKEGSENRRWKKDKTTNLTKVEEALEWE